MSRAWPRCPVLTGSAWALGLGVTAEMILPRAHRAATAPVRYLMTPIDPDFPTRIAPGDIVVGGEDFAAGTDDDAGVRALLAAGIAATVASSFDPQFARFALARGLPAVEVNESLAIHTGERLRVDIEGARVVNMSSGDRYPIRNVDETFLERFRPTDA
jgi:3-isopropylmalate/(R)-2-methylmalate dehydratase small subunit